MVGSLVATEFTEALEDDYILPDLDDEPFEFEYDSPVLEPSRSSHELGGEVGYGAGCDQESVEDLALSLHSTIYCTEELPEPPENHKPITQDVVVPLPECALPPPPPPPLSPRPKSVSPTPLSPPAPSPPPTMLPPLVRGQLLEQIRTGKELRQPESSSAKSAQDRRLLLLEQIRDKKMRAKLRSTKYLPPISQADQTSRCSAPPRDATPPMHQKITEGAPTKPKMESSARDVLIFQRSQLRTVDKHRSNPGQAGLYVGPPKDATNRHGTGPFVVSTDRQGRTSKQTESSYTKKLSNTNVYAPVTTKESDIYVPVIKAGCLNCSCKDKAESSRNSALSLLDLDPNHFGVRMKEIDRDMSQAKEAMLTLEGCLSKTSESGTAHSDRESARIAIDATNVALHKWAVAQSMLEEAIAVSKKAAQGKLAAEEKSRALTAMVHEMMAANKRQQKLIDELQLSVARQRRDAEHVARAASALVLKHAAPASAIDANWIGGIWLTVGEAHPQLEKAEKSWSSGHGQRALNELQVLLNEREDESTEPPGTETMSLGQKLGLFKRPSSAHLNSANRALPVSLEQPAPLTEAGLLANLLRAAILLGASQAVHGAAVASAMVAEAQKRQQWLKAKGLEAKDCELERRAKWIRGCCLLRQGREVEAKIAFAICCGSSVDDKILDKGLGEEELKRLGFVVDGQPRLENVSL